MKSLLVCLFLGLATSALAQTPLSINFTANAALTGTTSYAFTGTGTITGLGTAALSGGGALDASLLSGTTVGVIPGAFSLIYSDGAVLIGTFNIPTGILVPQLGGSGTGMGSVTITGGTGRFEGARGTFSPLTGTGTASGSTAASVVVNGSGTLSVGQYVLPQFVTGGGWYTALYFSNSKNTTSTFDVHFVADNGTPLSVPSLNSTFTTVVIPAGGTARIEAPNSGPLVQGYASVALPEGVTGYGVFRQSVPGTPDQEAVVPLTNAASSSASLTFDDTNFITAVGIVNPSSLGATVTVTAKNATGGALGTATIPLPAKTKTAVSLRSLTGLSGIANNRGSVTFTVTTGSVAVLGLRFFGSAFTSIPATDH
jgi:hypothetical protein